MNDRALQELRTLAERDAELSERTASLRELDAGVAAIRARAEEIEAFFVAYPESESRRRKERDDAEHELQRRHDDHTEAARLFAEAHDEEARLHAEHGLARAIDHVAVAEARVARARTAYDELEHDASRLPRELEELEQRARTLPGVPAFTGSLVEWASHAHAELFVSAGQIDLQRERVIREANELASMLLGEPAYGTTVAQALALVER